MVIMADWWFWNMTFPYIGNVMIPNDELHHFFRGVGIPPTRWRLMVVYCGIIVDIKSNYWIIVIIIIYQTIQVSELL